MENETLLDLMAGPAGDPALALLGILFFVLGLLYLGMPRKLLAMRAWWLKRTLDADFRFSERTVSMYRIFGVLLLILGIALYA